jgi:hypothetical protein
MHRSSTYSTSGNSALTFSSESKQLLMGLGPGERTVGALVAYPYDPAMDESGPLDEEDMMHDPTQRYHHDLRKKTGGKGEPFNWRGFTNIGMVLTMVTALLCLFVGYPAIVFLRDKDVTELITDNPLVNSTGQVPFFSTASTGVDP